MRLFVSSLFALLLVVADAAAVAQDEPAAPPVPAVPAPPPKPLTTEQAADAVVAAVSSKDDAALKALAAKDAPDPWLVADELLFRGEADDAEAFAKAAPRVDVERLPAYVASRRADARDVARRQALAEADIALDAGKFADALATLDAVKRGAADVGCARLDFVRGMAERGAGRLEQSVLSLRSASDVASAIGWLVCAGDGLHEGAMSAWMRSDFRSALELFKARLEIDERRGSRLGVAATVGNIGAMQECLDDYDGAIASYERSVTLSEQVGDRVGAVTTLANIGNIHYRRGQYTEALDVWRAALRQQEALDDREGYARTLGNIGWARFLTGEFADGLAIEERALKLKVELGDTVGAAATLGNIGEIYRCLGDSAHALVCQERALKLKQDLGDRSGVALTLYNVGGIHASLGDYPKALDFEGRALELAEELGERVQIANILGFVGGIHASLGDYPKALEFEERSLKLSEELGDRSGVAWTLLNIGAYHQSLRDYAKALDAYERAARLAADVGVCEAQVRAEVGIASVNRAAGRLREAVSVARDAVAGMAGLVRGVGEEQGAAARSRFESVFDIGAGAAASQGDAASVCFFLESGRAGTLTESLAARGALGAALLPPELRAAEIAAHAREAAATAALRLAVDGGHVVTIAAARKEVDAARTEVGDVIARIQREAKAVANVAYPVADSLDAIRARLKDGEALVLCGLPAADDAIALVVTAKDARIARLGRTSDVEAACAAMTPDAPDSDPAAAVAALRELVVEPLGLDAKTTRLLVSPHGALSYVPFALLLGDRDVVYVPSGTTYGVLLVDASKKGEGVLALGDPAYDVRSDAAAAAVAIRGATKLVQLPATGVEAKAVGDVALLGKDATEAGLAAALAKKPRWRAVHLACHGLVDPERPMFSSLALTPSGEDDGFLTALEVLRMKCPADLVVLSACETGKGRVYKAEGIVGLTRAFMFAGAPRVLVSLWKVDDEATSALMKRFYELWNPKDGKGVAAATALRQAQESIRSQEKWKHPRFWAAWVLWGVPE